MVTSFETSLHNSAQSFQSNDVNGLQPLVKGFNSTNRRLRSVSVWCELNRRRPVKKMGEKNTDLLCSKLRIGLQICFYVRRSGLEWDLESWMTIWNPTVITEQSILTRTYALCCFHSNRSFRSEERSCEKWLDIWQPPFPHISLLPVSSQSLQTEHSRFISLSPYFRGSICSLARAF